MDPVSYLLQPTASFCQLWTFNLGQKLFTNWKEQSLLRIVYNLVNIIPILCRCTCPTTLCTFLRILQSLPLICGHGLRGARSRRAVALTQGRQLALMRFQTDRCTSEEWRFLHTTSHQHRKELPILMSSLLFKSGYVEQKEEFIHDHQMVLLFTNMLIPQINNTIIALCPI